jgi:ubiquinone/menaquinone biosynthesis C-methylase UbiE
MSKGETPQDAVPPEMVAHYQIADEARRLSSGVHQLELARTQEILERYLPRPPAVILDVGGGPGLHACWLAKQGYEVHLVDAVPFHVEQAKRASDQQPDHPIASLAIGDARALDRLDDSVDVVLLMGPLYHLTERSDRVAALREANRVLKSRGLLFAVAISRFASLLDALVRGLIDDPEFAPILERDLIDGQHRNPTDNPAYFTTAFFHLPGELEGEIQDAGLRHEITLSIEGPGWLLQDFEERWRDPDRRKRLLDAVQATETAASLLGVGAHMMAVARKSA